MKRELDFSLYVITGANYHPGRSVVEVMEEALQGGADIVQLRDKTATPEELREQALQLRSLTRRYGVPLLINDHVELALEVEADGVHLGQGDLPLAEARRRLGAERIIGISTHAIAQARAAEAGGADYIGVGPVYPTGTKPGAEAVTVHYVQQVARELRIPFVAIGGINTRNAAEVLRAGATRLCAVSAIVGSADVRGAARALSAQILEARGGNYTERELMLNGKPMRLAAASLAQLVARCGQVGRRVVLELNGTAVPQANWAATPLVDGDKVELVHFVGGG